MDTKNMRHNLQEINLRHIIAIQVKSMREGRGWSVQELAEKAGLKTDAVSLIERPDVKKGIDLGSLKKIAAAFDVALLVRFTPFSYNSAFTTPTGFTEELPPEVQS